MLSCPVQPWIPWIPPCDSWPSRPSRPRLRRPIEPGVLVTVGIVSCQRRAAVAGRRAVEATVVALPSATVEEETRQKRADQ